MFCVYILGRYVRRRRCLFRRSLGGMLVAVCVRSHAFGHFRRSP